MNADKRTVVTDALETLGKIISNNEKRDAIHLAVEPVIAGRTLRPGEHVGLVNGKATRCDKPLGIVDPFLNKAVKPGEWFWLVVYPRTIRSLRHVWEHPDFPESIGAEKPIENKEEISRQWIEDFSNNLGVDSAVILSGARKWINSHDGKWGGTYLCLGGLLEGETVPDEFWDHYEIVTGAVVPKEMRQSFFTCSC